jgi:hypothetical protein
MKIYLTAVFLYVSSLTMAQFSDDFSDGDFTADPTWTGDTERFDVTGAGELQLNAPPETDTAYLVTPSSVVDDAVWDFYMRCEFNPSASNLGRVYLMSDSPNLKTALNGYFVQVGNTPDEISLYRQTGFSITKIIDGVDDAVDMDPVELRVRVTRDAIGNWELLRDTTGGFDFIAEGTVFDDVHTVCTHTGVFAKYTSTRADKFFFDDLGTPFGDTDPPTIVSVSAVSETQLNVVFSEPVDELTAELLGNYAVNLGIGSPSFAQRSDIDENIVLLTFSETFELGTLYLMNCMGVEDLSGNSLVPEEVEFDFILIAEATWNDVVISEFMADPSPPVNLPEVEFIELFNRSEKYVNLANWKIADFSSTAEIPEYILYPGKYVLLCNSGDAVLFDLANSLEVSSLPSLNNAVDKLTVQNEMSIPIDSLTYTLAWYQDADKEEGGWSLERINLSTNCGGKNNWKAAVDEDGGTPGKINSVWSEEEDVLPPEISAIEVLADTIVNIAFAQSMDTSQNFSIDINPVITDIFGTYTDAVNYVLNVKTLSQFEVYEIALLGGKDCPGNEANFQFKFALPSEPAPEDILLNELLFNPQTGASDYVELYNISAKTFDLSKVYIANWDNEMIHNFKQISAEQKFLYPNTYVLITPDTMAVKDNYGIYESRAFVQSNLPSLPNTEGSVYVVKEDTTVIDYLIYTEDMHFSLLDDLDGKALERLNFSLGMNRSANWHTASEAVDWGTPGYENSQFIANLQMGKVSIEPQLFSPDNDGVNDVLGINLSFVLNDLLLDIKIYDHQGRLIRKLADNFFIGQEAFLSWDGINDNGEKAAIGTYVILISVNDQKGYRETFKKVAVLGGHF